MKLVSTVDTKDGRLTAGKVYVGQIIMKSPPTGYGLISDLRFCCFDNTGTWMTFNLDVFRPVGKNDIN